MKLSNRFLIRSMLPTRSARFRHVLTVGVLLAGCPTAAWAADWYVDSGASCAAGDGSTFNPFCSIQTAITAASSGDTVYIAGGSYVEPLVVDRNLTLVGTDGADVTRLSVVPTPCSFFPGPRVITFVAGVMCDLSGVAIVGTGDYPINNNGGVYVESTASVLLTDCFLAGNRSSWYSTTRGGAGVYNSGNLILDRCVVENNLTCIPLSDSPSGPGGGIFNDGTLAIVASTIRENVVGDNGGGIYNRGALTLSSSVVHSNTAFEPCAFGFVCAGLGGGIYHESGILTVSSSTLTGNIAEVGGGGLHTATNDWQAGTFGIGAVTLDHSIVALNQASTIGCGVDVCGTITSFGHNLVGDILGSTITGPGTGDLYGLDPRFADLQGSLQAGSPCVDAGDPSLTSGGTDLSGNPRRLDGDLDLTVVQDMGAFEFGHVRLSVSGAATPGGTLTLESSGTAGMLVLLFIGSTPGEVCHALYGCLFLDPLGPLWILPWGTLPSNVSVPLAPGLSTPLKLVFQELALDPTNLAGNTSNSVEVAIE